MFISRNLIRSFVLATIIGTTGMLATVVKAAPAVPLALMATKLEGQINLNTATAEQLQLLPGVGPATADRIILYRDRRPFTQVVHLMRVKGIGRKRFAALKPYLVVEGETTLQAASP